MATLRLAAANSDLALRSPSSAASTIARRRFSSAAFASVSSSLQLFNQRLARLLIFRIGGDLAGSPLPFDPRLGLGPFVDQAEDLAQNGPFTLENGRLG